jgi:hypothetical protein
MLRADKPGAAVVDKGLIVVIEDCGTHKQATACPASRSIAWQQAASVT